MEPEKKIHSLFTKPPKRNIDIETTMSWEEEGSIIKGRTKELNHSSKIAAFDMDSTLIITKSGKRFAKDYKDWQWWHRIVPSIMISLHKEGFKIIIITNQGGISKGKTRKSDITKKIESIQLKLGVPMSAYIAMGDDYYRKPCVGI